MEDKEPITLFWFRRDLRLEDNTALYHALKNNTNVLPIFIFDTTILNELEDKSDRRVCFIYGALQHIQQQLINIGSSLMTLYGEPCDELKKLTERFCVNAVYANHDYEPTTLKRDEGVKNLLLAKGIPFYTFKDQVLFEKQEILKNDATPYTVYTPYMKKWKTMFSPAFIRENRTTTYFHSFFKTPPFPIVSLKEMGFMNIGHSYTPPVVDFNTIRQYHLHRDYPAQSGTSRLSPHLRFGTISIRQLIHYAREYNDTWLNELIWREFFMMILFHFPYVVNSAFKQQYNRITWDNNELLFEHWCKGQTGFPLVDAGMRELNETGLMHNRVRMVTASFLVKNLLIDWRWGEAYFAKKLLDFDLAANNGNWQWAAGCGCDAAPYFRIFNPHEQLKKFDPSLTYIKKWIPEYNTHEYSEPVIDYKISRIRVLERYKQALQNA